MKTALFSAAKKLSPCGTTLPRYSRTSSGWLCTASEMEQKMMPSLASRSLKVVATDTLSNTASTATGRRSSSPSSLRFGGASKLVLRSTAIERLFRLMERK